jgi:hypothetical protein
MRRMKLLSLLAFIFTVCLGMALLSEDHQSAVVPNASFDKMKTLDGAWVGTMIDGGKEYPATTRFTIVSDGSALMSWLGEGTPNEMVTIFHMDGANLMGTHYCAAHNQPRMVATPGGGPNRIDFKFKDGTNIGPHDGHMTEVAFIFDGPDHHIQEWTYLDNHGKLSTGRFDFRRKK